MATHRPDSMEAIGERLRLIRLAYSLLQRREKEISQAEFARLCQIETTAWNNVERGNYRIGLDNAMLLARRTGATLDYIYRDNPAGLPHALASAIEAVQAAERPAKRA